MTMQGTETNRSVSPLDREQIALIEVGVTDVRSSLARVMVTAFLVLLFALPLIELSAALRERAPSATGVEGPGASVWSHLGTLSGEIDRRLTALSLEAPAAGAWLTVVTANRAVLQGLGAFETALEDQSAVGRLLRPPAQHALSGWLGAGNERVYVGRDGWLFYRPDVEYVTGTGFLDERAMRRRLDVASEYQTVPQPDPRPAIRQFARDLEARGITLVLVPTPVKPSIHGEQLAPALTGGAASPLHNASFDAWVDDMRRADVWVFDPTPHIAGVHESGPQYLATDTHWRPETMQRVVEALAAFLSEHVTLPPVPAPGYVVERREARQFGDTAAMLGLPSGQTLYPPERVSLRFVVDAAGDPWRPSADADVLVLGDSFSNIYSLASMGWGESAGLVEQLSYVLQRPIDRIVQNADGAFATRALLQRDSRGALERLARTRVVVWQFAARELAFGDWQILPLR